MTALTPAAYRKRVAEIRRENARAEKAARHCAACGCTRTNPCTVAISDNEAGVCAFIECVARCSACLTKGVAARVPAKAKPRAAMRRAS